MATLRKAQVLPKALGGHYLWVGEQGGHSLGCTLTTGRWDAEKGKKRAFPDQWREPFNAAGGWGPTRLGQEEKLSWS